MTAPDVSNCGKHVHLVSVIIPVYNGAAYLEECLESVKNQVLVTELDDFGTRMNVEIEVSIYDDSSTDETPQLLRNWESRLASVPGFSVVCSRNDSGKPCGVGYAKNRAVEQSTGEFLCFCDADDVMHPERVVKQLKAARSRPTAIVGSRFNRIPLDSTRNFSRWANGLNESQLYTQIYQSFGPTLVMPTWFCHRSVFNKVKGGFSEGGRGVPEDLIFFYSHLDVGGTLYRVDKELLMYRYHPQATTFSVNEVTIWNLRFRRLEDLVLSLPDWNSFTIWGAGKLGRRFFRSLTTDSKRKVAQFCDVDRRKLDKGTYQPYPNPEGLSVPIVSHWNSHQPYVICIKMEYTWAQDSPFTQFVKERELEEGKDFVHFS